MLGKRAQISIEMIVIMAALVAVVLFFVTRLQNTATTAGQKIEESSNKIWEEIDKID